MKKTVITFLIFIYFLLSSIYFTYPLILNLGNALPGLGDPQLITWILNWDIYAFSHFPLNIFNANIYYSFHNSLSFSDAFLTSAALVFIPAMILGEPAAAYNINLIISFFTLGFFTYLLIRYLTKDYFSSMTGGTLVAFSTYTLGKTMHPQLIGIQWVPLCLLFFLKFIEKKKYRNLLIAATFFILQTYNSFLPGYFIVISLICLLTYLTIKKRIILKQIINMKILILFLLIVLFIIPIVLPYFSTSSKFNYVRDIREAIHTANRPEYFFYSYGNTKLQPFLINILYKNNRGPFFYDGYLGGALIVLSFLALIYRLFYKKKKIHFYFDAFLAIGIFSFILSLGPALQWAGKVIKLPFIIPLPYAIFYYLMPGFKGFRNSGRWEMLTVFAFSVAIGLCMAKILKTKSLYTKIFLTVIISFFIFVEYPFPLKLYMVPQKKEFPPVYSYINTLPKNSSIIELPMYAWNMFSYSYHELNREYFSTLHFHPMVNGASGFSPPEWIDQAFTFMLEFPNNETIYTLKKNKVNYVILHKEEYDQMEKDKFMIGGVAVNNWKKVYSKISQDKSIIFIKRFGNDFIYEIKND